MGLVTHETGRCRMQRDLVLATPRLVLTSWLPGDVDSLLEVHSDPETMRFVRHGRPESRDETAQLVDHYIAEQAARGWTKWRLTDADGALVGRAGFEGDATDRQLSFTIRRSHWGLGLATEIAGALVGWHVSHAGAASLRAIAAVGNHASVRVLEKVGFHEVGTEDFDGTLCHSFVHRSW
jgi:[ribosomal protein S5]-alanine N-acetyltransferase